MATGAARSARESAADRAHAAIREAIRTGEIAPGVMLSENELAAELSLSRTPVRAALARLQDEGWVTIYAQRGALVRELTADDMREGAEMRFALESAAVELAGAAQRAGLADRMAANVDQQEAALRAEDFPAFVTLAMEFHRGFVEVAGNQLMLTTYDRLQDRQHLSIVGSRQWIVQQPEQVVAQHRRLLDIAQQGDWQAFRQQLRVHQSDGDDTGTGFTGSRARE